METIIVFAAAFYIGWFVGNSSAYDKGYEKGYMKGTKRAIKATTDNLEATLRKRGVKPGTIANLFAAMAAEIETSENDKP